MSAIRVDHPGASYDVLIGGIDSLADRISAIADGRRLPLISDQKVFQLYGRSFQGIAVDQPILLPEGERAKQWPVLAEVIDQLASLEVKRGTPILALGGGSVGDVAGLAASIFKRGCPVIHVPTTLLAQADSAIGGKTAIDAHGQKNLVGTFHHPALVAIDPSFLDTLDTRQLRSGYAEVVKYGLIDDPVFFEWCEAIGNALIAGDPSARLHAVEHCVRAKARFVSEDPLDTTGKRALLNFGHSFGHAIEALGGDEILHGEAVAVGMAMAFRLSVTLGLCANDDCDRVKAHLASAGLPTTLGDVGLAGRGDELAALMAHDKKADQSGLALVLARGIGQATLVREFDQGKLIAYLREPD